MYNTYKENIICIFHHVFGYVLFIYKKINKGTVNILIHNIFLSCVVLEDHYGCTSELFFINKNQLNNTHTPLVIYRFILSHK